MTRLFIAITLPATIRTALAALKTPIRGARWVKAEQMHLTLRFIGAIDAGRKAQITTALTGVQTPEFELAMQGVGYFPPRRALRVLWAGLAENPRLLELHEAVEAALEPLGFAREPRLFAAHITLARFDNAPFAAAQQFVTDHHDFKFAPFAVREFHLYSSELQPSGAIYRCLETYPLLKDNP